MLISGCRFRQSRVWQNKKENEMNVKELKEALAAYPDDMEVEICEGKVKMTDGDEVILDPYWDFNTLVLTYQSMIE